MEITESGKSLAPLQANFAEIPVHWSVRAGAQLASSGPSGPSGPRSLFFSVFIMCLSKFHLRALSASAETGSIYICHLRKTPVEAAILAP